MLHMVVNTHNAESCAFRSDEDEKILTAGIEAFQGTKEFALKGWWINRTAHEFFILVDAPNAHVIEDALVDAGLVGRTHSRILPVNTAKDVLAAS